MRYVEKALRMKPSHPLSLQVMAEVSQIILLWVTYAFISYFLFLIAYGMASIINIVVVIITFVD